jgi:cold shock CspA family protein
MTFLTKSLFVYSHNKSHCGKIVHLETLSESRSPSEFTNIMSVSLTAERVFGTVTLFDKASGGGVVTLPDGREALFRYSSIRGEGVRQLPEGTPVSFMLQETTRGLYAVCVEQE